MAELDCEVGIHCHDDSGVGVANSLAGVRAGATMVQGTMNGYGERCGNANLVTIVPNLQLKMGHECLPSLTGLTEAAHFLDELLNFVPDPDQPYVGKNAFAHKGGLHVAGVNADPATFEHIDPAAVGNSRDVLISELSGRGTVLSRAEQTGVALDDAAASRVVERVKELEHRGFQFEAADGSFDLLIRRETGEYEPLFQLESWRVMAEKREDGKVQTEATIKIWVDGERYVRTAEGNGPVNALGHRAARGDLRDLSAPARHQARQLQGPHPRRVEGDRRGHARAARRLRRPRHLGRDRRARERDRGELGRARRLARGRHAARARGAPPRERGAAPRVSADPLTDEIPLARPVLGAEEEAAVIEVLRSGQLSLGPRVPAFEEAFAARLGARHASAVSSGTAGLHLALRAVGVSDGDEVVTSPFSFVASANVIAYERATPGVRRHRPGHAQPRPRRGGRRRSPTARPRCSRSTSSATPPTSRRSRRTACRSSRTPARRSARSTPTASRSAAAATRRCSASTPTSSSPPARAGWSRSAPTRTRSRSTPSATRAARPTWTGSTTTGSASTTGCRTSRRAIGLAQLERLDGMLADRARVAEQLPRGAGAARDASAGSGCRARTPAATAAAGSCSWSSSRAGVDRDDTIRALRELGVQSKPYLPAIHLMSFYRERFGHRPGEFPVAEDVAARSVALPFFPELSEGQVARVAEALGRVLG